VVAEAQDLTVKSDQQGHKVLKVSLEIKDHKASPD
jgi:hypothetical protein